MINALHSSRDNGTKLFDHGDSKFGWADVYKMWIRECKISSGSARMVPQLRESHIIRDPWTKLNVSPAKILQVSNIDFSTITQGALFRTCVICSST